MSPATQIVHWPGRDTAACDDHMMKLLRLAQHMGFVVSVTPYEPTICANCENESSKFKEQP